MKRSKTIALIMMSASTIALTACDEPRVDAAVYDSVQQCIDDSKFSKISPEQCEAQFAAASEQHAKVAPKYTSQADCEADFGNGQCETAPYQTRSGGSVFMPLMMGYMMGRMMGSGVAPQPLYRSSDDRTNYRTADNRKVGPAKGFTTVARSATRTPSMKTSTVSRGGFGASARAGGYSPGPDTRFGETTMQRVPVAERDDWKETAREHGFDFHSIDDDPYWDESAYYRFTLRQIEDELEDVTEELESLCFGVIERAMADEEVLRRLAIPEYFWDLIAESWRQKHRNLYGRMDFSYDGKGPAKLLEYNADTPTTLYETAIFQWVWLEQAMDRGLVLQGCDQFNSVHERLLEALPQLGIEGVLHLAYAGGSEEDKGTVEYIADCARQAGLQARLLEMEDIGVDADGRFTDLDDEVITSLFKLYPWEWILTEEFGRYVPRSGVRFIEPAWKTILSNKGAMALLWEMNEGHPNLLPTFFEDDPRAASLDGAYIRKPLLSREGLNVELIRDGKTVSRSDGPYGAEGHVVQAYHPLPEFDGNYPMTGCWLVASQPAGMCIREDRSPITSDDSRFIPHLILD